jgi:hypothetical protein
MQIPKSIILTGSTFSLAAGNWNLKSVQPHPPTIEGRLAKIVIWRKHYSVLNMSNEKYIMKKEIL